METNKSATRSLT